MTYADISAMVERMGTEIGAPSVYGLFPEGAAPEPPYLVFYYPEETPFYADDQVYARFAVIYLELYTSQRELDMELVLERQLSARHMGWDKQEEYVEEEALYMVRYAMTALLTV